MPTSQNHHKHCAQSHQMPFGMLYTYKWNGIPSFLMCRFVLIYSQCADESCVWANEQCSPFIHEVQMNMDRCVRTVRFLFYYCNCGISSANINNINVFCVCIHFIVPLRIILFQQNEVNKADKFILRLSVRRVVQCDFSSVFD